MSVSSYVHCQAYGADKQAIAKGHTHTSRAPASAAAVTTVLFLAVTGFTEATTICSQASSVNDTARRALKDVW